MPQLDERLLLQSFTRLLSELLEGPAPDAAFMLNRGDRGLFASLDELSSDAASSQAGGRSSVAAHVDHLRYALSLLNRWARGADPWKDADFGASWRRLRVTDTEWRELCEALKSEALAWRSAVGERREWDSTSMTEVMASAAHLAYHLAAIRQIQPRASGPPAKD